MSDFDDYLYGTHILGIAASTTGRYQTPPILPPRPPVTDAPKVTPPAPAPAPAPPPPPAPPSPTVTLPPPPTMPPPSDSPTPSPTPSPSSSDAFVWMDDEGNIYDADKLPLDDGSVETTALEEFVYGGDVVLGAVDVDGLAKRFDELPHDNITAHQIWGLHGYPLAQRVGAAAQDILAKAIVPTNEFAYHSQVMAFTKRADSIAAKVGSTPYDTNPSPYWEDVRSYILDGSRLVNTLEGVSAGSLKWSDVKQSAAELAAGLKGAAKEAGSTIKWTTGLLIGGTVVLGGALIYGVYKLLSGPTGQAVGHGLGSAAGKRLTGGL